MNKRYFATYSAFQEGLLEEWNNLSLDRDIRSEYHSIKDRLDSVVELDGGPTKY